MIDKEFMNQHEMHQVPQQVDDSGLKEQMQQLKQQMGGRVEPVAVQIKNIVDEADKNAALLYSKEYKGAPMAMDLAEINNSLSPNKTKAMNNVLTKKANINMEDLDYESDEDIDEATEDEDDEYEEIV